MMQQYRVTMFIYLTDRRSKIDNIILQKYTGMYAWNSDTIKEMGPKNIRTRHVASVLHLMPQMNTCSNVEGAINYPKTLPPNSLKAYQSVSRRAY